MMALSNIEFYSTPDGEVMIKEHNHPVRKLEETNRDLVQTLFITIRVNFIPRVKGIEIISNIK